jgi:hypothetical protein
LSAWKVKKVSCPGLVEVNTAPPPGPVTACRSIECGKALEVSFLRCSSTVSPRRMRIIGAGIVPLKVK